jgi:hypothetical protein
MKSSNLRTVLFASAVTFAGLALTACGVQGTYTDPTGGVVIELKSDDKASFAMMGQTAACTYKVDGDKIPITCEGQTLVFTKQGDGSLAPPAGSMFGALKKK